MENKHPHYEVQSYSKTEIDANKQQIMHNVSTIIVVAANEKEALQKAKKLLVRKGYRVSKVWECLETHGIQTEMQMAQLELQKKTYDLMKGYHG